MFASTSSNSTTTILSTTISGNSADEAVGGMATSTESYMGAVMTVAHSTITGNISDADTSGTGMGGGMSNSYGYVTLDHSIVADNIDNTGLRPDIIGPVTASYSLIGNTIGATITDNGGNILNQPAMLGPLQNNGGLTETHELLAGSMAIDMGEPAASPGVGTVPLYDQRGNNFGRVQNGRIDMGAFEVPSTPSADFDSDGFITGLDFLLWQIGLGTSAPNAVKTDGDADNDLDADHSDLDVWDVQFGMAAPVVAASTAPLTVESLPVEPVATEPTLEPSLASSDLVDVALAVELASDVADVEAPPLDGQRISPVATTDTAFATGDIAPRLRASVGADRLVSSFDETDESEDQWITDELLERVFG